MIGKGTILLLHDHEVPNLNIYKTLFDNANASNVLHTLPFSRLHPHPDEELTADRLSTMNKNRIDTVRKRIARIRETRALLNAGGFDGFVAASKFHPTGLLDIVTPFLEGSRPVVVYHQYVEVSTFSVSLHHFLYIHYITIDTSRYPLSHFLYIISYISITYSIVYHQYVEVSTFSVSLHHFLSI
jgi:hypothetical protein